MRGFKLTSWNVEHADTTLTDLDGQAGGSAANVAAKQQMAERKIAAIRAEIAALGSDILFVCEGPRGPERAARYFALTAPDHQLITRQPPGDSDYATDGAQWLWFLVRRSLVAQLSPQLLPVATWQAYTRDQSQQRHTAGVWRASLPTFDRDKNNPADMGRQGPHKLTRHSHYRHPQVLRVTCNGLAVEIIGVHLKAKFVDQKPRWMRWVAPKGSNGNAPDYDDIADAIGAAPGYMVASVAARAKLSSEASDVRYYIERRFAQDVDPAIFVVGDVNDGPGKELIEEWFLLHDLIGNLQGDVFEARSFLNHALFDFEERLRWTVEFKDAVDPRRPPRILIDHILFTQRLSGAGKGGLRVMPKAGRVEHAVHEQVASLLPNKITTSDHRPVSVTVTAVDASGQPLPG